MSGAAAVFININMLCEATVDSGCDVTTPLKHHFSPASFSFFPSLPSLCSLCGAALHLLSLTLSPKAITMTNSPSHDAFHIPTLVLFPVWQSVESICQAASSWPAHSTISTIGKTGGGFIASEQLGGAVFPVHSFTFHVINSTSYWDCGASPRLLKLVQVTRLKKKKKAEKAACFSCSALHSFVGKEVFFKKTFREPRD